MPQGVSSSDTYWTTTSAEAPVIFTFHKRTLFICFAAFQSLSLGLTVVICYFDFQSALRLLRTRWASVLSAPGTSSRVPPAESPAPWGSERGPGGGGGRPRGGARSSIQADSVGPVGIILELRPVVRAPGTHHLGGQAGAA